jgi:protein involved in polysaccharide export with SLBB domain
MLNSMRIPFLFISVAALWFLAGCGGGTEYVARDFYVEFSPEQVQEIETEDSQEYRIQEGDILKLAFSYLKELDQDEVVVLPDGSVTLVGVDRVKLAGYTITEADSIVTAAYSKEYRDPSLSLIIRKTEGRRIYVLGEVDDPGLHVVPRGGLDIIGAISVAGGFTDDAARAGTVLIRVQKDGYLVREVDLSGFHTVAYHELAGVTLQTYDVVYVPRSRMGDFGYFSKTFLAGVLNLTRIAADIRYLSGATTGRLF